MNGSRFSFVAFAAPRLSVSVAMLVVTCLAALTGCAGGAGLESPVAPKSAPEAQSGGHGEPTECPQPPDMATPPRRVVTMDGGAAAILHRLGVGDRIVGTASPDFFAPFSGAEREALDAIPVLDPGQGNAEAVIAAKPDLVVGTSNYNFGSFDGTPTVDRLAEAGAKSLVACEPKDKKITDLSQTTAFIEHAAKIFGVQQRGAELIAELESSADQAKSAADNGPTRVLTLSTPPTGGKPIVTKGGKSLANGVITMAGGKNIAESSAMNFANLSSEQVITDDPQAIVVISGLHKGSDEQLRDAIRSSPLLSPTTAVRENRIVTVPHSTILTPSVLNGQAVTQIAETLRKPAS